MFVQARYRRMLIRYGPERNDLNAETHRRGDAEDKEVRNAGRFLRAFARIFPKHSTSFSASLRLCVFAMIVYTHYAPPEPRQIRRRSHSALSTPSVVSAAQ